MTVHCTLTLVPEIIGPIDIKVLLQGVYAAAAIFVYGSNSFLQRPFRSSFLPISPLGELVALSDSLSGRA